MTVAVGYECVWMVRLACLFRRREPNVLPYNTQERKKLRHRARRPFRASCRRGARVERSAQVVSGSPQLKLSGPADVF